MSEENKTIKKRTLTGVVTSAKMTNTATVAITRLKKDRLYKKYHKVTTKYHAHNPDNQYKEGDNVTIEATRPMSKTKRWQIVGKAK